MAISMLGIDQGATKLTKSRLTASQANESLE